MDDIGSGFRSVGRGVGYLSPVTWVQLLTGHPEAAKRSADVLGPAAIATLAAVGGGGFGGGAPASSGTLPLLGPTGATLTPEVFGAAPTAGLPGGAGLLGLFGGGGGAGGNDRLSRLATQSQIASNVAGIAQASKPPLPPPPPERPVRLQVQDFQPTALESLRLSQLVEQERLRRRRRFG